MNVLDEVDFQIIFALAMGQNQEEAGRFVCTPLIPGGITDRTVRNRINAHRAEYDRLIPRFALAINQKQLAFEEITKEQYREKLQKLRAKGLKVKELALDSGIEHASDVEKLSLAVKVAEGLEERDLGKATQVHKMEGQVEHTHRLTWNPQPIRALAQQEADMLNSQKLLSALSDTSDAVEAEVVS